MSWIVTGAVVGGAAGFLGGTKGKKAQTDPYGALNPEQRSMLQAMAPGIQSSATAEAPQYGGQLTAEMSPQEAGYYNTGRGSLMSGTLDTMLQDANDPVAFNNSFNKGMVDPTMQNFNQNTLPGMMEGYAGFSTAGANARAQALNTVGNDLAIQRYQGQQAAKDRALSAMGQYKNVSDYMAAPRVFQQAGLDRKYNDYIQGNQQKQQNIDNALKFLGLSTGTYTPAVKDTRWSGMLQGGMMGAFMGSGMGGGAAATSGSGSWGAAGFPSNGLNYSGPSQSFINGPMSLSGY